jgi:CO/xanthine dehydrogenase FAD-binding subunit
MAKKPTAYYRPKSPEEALQLLAQPGTMPLAGGTSLLAGDVNGAVVDLQDVGLTSITIEAGRLQIEAMIRLAELADFLAGYDDGSNPAALLTAAVSRSGPNTVRNAATIGGLVGSRWPDSELLAALLVLNGDLTVRIPVEQQLSLGEYLAARQRVAGLITAIMLEWGPGQGGSERVARTPADDPIVSVTLWRPEGQLPRLAATGIATYPLRLAEAEASLAEGIDERSIYRAAAAAREAAGHPGDFRGDAHYRAEMAAVLTSRLLTGCLLTS